MKYIVKGFVGTVEYRDHNGYTQTIYKIPQDTIESECNSVLLEDVNGGYFFIGLFDEDRFLGSRSYFPYIEEIIAFVDSGDKCIYLSQLPELVSVPELNGRELSKHALWFCDKLPKSFVKKHILVPFSNDYYASVIKPTPLTIDYDDYTNEVILNGTTDVGGFQKLKNRTLMKHSTNYINEIRFVISEIEIGSECTEDYTIGGHAFLYSKKSNISHLSTYSARGEFITSCPMTGRQIYIENNITDYYLMSIIDNYIFGDIVLKEQFLSILRLIYSKRNHF